MLELRSKCHGAPVKEVHDPKLAGEGLSGYYECEKCRTRCEISIVNEDWDVEEEGRALFAWQAYPRSIAECVSWIQDLIRKLKGGK